MASSLTSPQLVFAANKAIIAAHRAIDSIRLFSTDFTADAVQPGTTLKIPVYKAQAAAFNAESNDYENPDGTVTWASITFGNHVKSTFEFTDKDFLEFARSGVWENATRASGESIALSIVDAVGGLVTAANITNDETLASITLANIAALRKTCVDYGIEPSKTVLLLDPANFAVLLSLLPSLAYGGSEAIRNGVIPSLYGFKAVSEFSGFKATETTLVGALIPEDAIAVAGRVVPVDSPAVYQEVGTETDPQSGLTLGIRRHGSPKTGTNFCTVEALFGAGFVQANKCVRLVSA